MKLEDVRNSFRQNVIPDDMEHISSIDLLSRNNKGRPLHSKLAAIIFRLLEAKIPEFKRENFNSIQVNYNAPMKKHTDDINIEHSFCFSFGDHSKGELIIYEPLENGGERKIIRNVFKKVLKYDGNVPHSVEAAGPGADGKTERYSVVVYRRDMGTEDNQNAFNIENEKRIEISKRRHARKASTANWPPMPKPGLDARVQGE